MSGGAKTVGALNGNWKGGRIVDPRGYVLVRVGKGHHLADVRGYAYEHRVLAERKLGRRLRRGEQVHHEDEKKSNNDPDNLETKKSRAEHAVAHRKPGCNRRLPDEPNPDINCECGCGESFPKFDQHKRPRRFVSGHNASRDSKGKFYV